ncbi:MAG TPA: Ig-like domain-containing protein [Trebonia sp.]|nr:Ig-like domain-containing protein [Trebonia sp.]
MHGCHRTTSSRLPRRAARLAAVSLTAATALLATACQGSGTPAATQLSTSAVSSLPAASASSSLTISPASGTKNANPANGITVAAVHGGKVSAVTVKTTSAHSVAGALSADGTSWHSTYALPTGASYTVTATGTDGSGHPVTATSTFATLTPASAFHTQIYEGAGATYGVGMPVMLTFDQPITNKAAVERALTLTTSNPVVGAWYWDGSERLDFRPRDYWPANTTVTLTSHLNGVEGAPGVYGVHDLTQTFNIGQSVISVANTTTHQAQVYIGGKLTYTWPMSSGKPSTPTPDGTYVTIDKHNPTRMIGGGPKGSPGYYDELVNWAVRFTFSGDYYHSAPWSVAQQGSTNVSHGCVNLSPQNSQTYYNLAVPGDPITVTSSPQAGNWNDGWTEWFLSWPQYLAGSATHLAVEAGPAGSTLVSPSAIPADTAAAPLGTSASGNYNAA